MGKAKSERILKPLLEALGELHSSDGRIRSAAYNFLKTDLSRLRTDNDFRRAYDGLAACLQLLGPLHPNYRKCLDDLRKVLDSYCRANSDMLPDEWVDQMEVLWTAYRGLLREFCPPDMATDLEKRTADYFKRLRGQNA